MRVNGIACILLGAAAAGFVVAGAPLAAAHDSVIGGTVVTGEALDEFPQQITLEFSGIPKEGFNTFAVTDTDTKEVLFDATPTIEGRNLTIDVPPGVETGPGNYQVGFQITSSDGHATRGSVPFTVAGASVSNTPNGSGDLNREEDNTDATGLAALPDAAKWVIGAGGILAGLAVIVITAARMRGTGQKG